MKLWGILAVFVFAALGCWERGGVTVLRSEEAPSLDAVSPSGPLVAQRTVDGAWEVDLRAAAQADAGGGALFSGGASVSLEQPTVRHPDCTDDAVERVCLEGNQSVLDARDVDVFLHVVEGVVAAGSSDWFRFDVPGACRLTLSAKVSSPESDVTLHLYQSGGLTRIAEGSQASVAWESPSATTLYLRVDSYGELTAYRLVPETNCTAPELEVVFMGDQSLSSGANAVLAMLASESPDLIVHLGDFDYADRPAEWWSRIVATLGPSPNYIGVIGNHDLPAWFPSSDRASNYQEVVVAQHNSVRGLRCEGELGVNADCRFRGLQLIESAIGTYPNTPDDLPTLTALREALNRPGPRWRACLWHKNQRDLQLGSKTDEVGWEAYSACSAAGAMILNGHEHSYSRTFTLTDFGVDAVLQEFGRVGEPDVVELGPGRTFVAVSGLAGRPRRSFRRDIHGQTVPPWWASAYAKDIYVRDATEVAEVPSSFGALFIRFHIQGDPGLAEARFLDTNAEVLDRFLIRTM